jgi:hypothetical protein
MTYSGTVTLTGLPALLEAASGRQGFTTKKEPELFSPGPCKMYFKF